MASLALAALLAGSLWRGGRETDAVPLAPGASATIVGRSEEGSLPAAASGAERRNEAPETRIPLEVAVVEELPSFGESRLRGTLTLIDAEGREHPRANGGFRLYVLCERPEENVIALRRLPGDAGRRTVTVRDGIWDALVPSDARIGVRELWLDGTRAGLEPLGELPVRPVRPDLRLDLRAHALYAQMLRVVDAETGRELQDVRVLAGDRAPRPESEGPPAATKRIAPGQPEIRLFDLAEIELGRVEGWDHFFSDGLPGTWLRGPSPLEVPVEPERHRYALVVHVPGYALEPVVLDQRAPHVWEVEMKPAGDLRVCVGPDARRRNLRITQPGSPRSAFGWHVPLFTDERREPTVTRHEWFEFDGAASVEIARDGAGGMELEIALVPSGRWRATLAFGDGEDGSYPPAMTDVIDELEVEITAGETTAIELAGCD